MLLKEHALTPAFLASIKKKKIKPGDRVVLLSTMGIVVGVMSAKASILWSSDPYPISDFSKFSMPLIRRVFHSLSAPSLISIQPMSVPAGGIFYQEYKFGSGSFGQ